MILTVKNWTDFQHYKHRNPPWIRLHRKTLDDYELDSLPMVSQLLAPKLWLVASECGLDGDIAKSPEAIAHRIRWDLDVFIRALIPLIEADFFRADSSMLARCAQLSAPEKSQSQITEAESLSGSNSKTLESLNRAPKILAVAR